MVDLVDHASRIKSRGTIRFTFQGAPDARYHMEHDRLSLPSLLTSMSFCGLTDKNLL